ncbi:MAG: ATP-binding cassette domain-containing protein [Gemmatimonadetes bacterium]|nr:ATP-binding cassette domain-containing protein [Gemmatimonadota bacterium]
MLGLRAAYGDVLVLRDVTLIAAGGSLTVLAGENGSGKSTLLGAIAGTVRILAGSVRTGEELLSGLTPPEIARRGVTRVLQRPRLVPSLSVVDNVVLGRLPRRGENAAVALCRWEWASEERASRHHALETLEHLGIASLADRPAGRLSAGQVKLVAFARARLHGGPIFLFDELLSGVAVEERRRLVAALACLAQEGAVVLSVEHEPTDLLNAGGVALRLRDGMVCEDRL